jgi:hypothetical protein
LEEVAHVIQLRHFFAHRGVVRSKNVAHGRPRGSGR